MGEVEGRQGTWAYVKGGMGALTQCVRARISEAPRTNAPSLSPPEVFCCNSCPTVQGTIPLSFALRPAVSQVAAAARDAGAEIATSACVSEVLTDASGSRATGVRLLGGEVVTARKAVVANCTPFHLFAELLGENGYVPGWLGRHVRHTDYSCGCVHPGDGKICTQENDFFQAQRADTSEAPLY